MYHYLHICRYLDYKSYLNFKIASVFLYNNKLKLFEKKNRRNNNLYYTFDELELNLNNEINIEESKFHIGSFCCNVTLVKKKKLWWNYLVKEKKLPNLEIDWNKWKEQDESDEELFDYNIPNNLEELMK